MNLLELYKRYETDIIYGMSYIVGKDQSRRHDIDKMTPGIRYWSREGKHRLYISMLGGPISYGYIDLITGEPVPQKRDINNILYTNERLNENKEKMKKAHLKFMNIIIDKASKELDEIKQLTDRYQNMLSNIHK